MKTAQRSFASGEVAPALYARTDTQRYAAGLRTLRNAYVMRTGGLQSRPGTIYKGTTKSNGQVRLVACVFADDQNYVLEFGNLYVRFWKDGNPVTATVTGAWADATAYAAGIVVSYSGTNYVSLQAHTSATATNRPSTGSAWTDYWAALANTTYELPTGYTLAQLNDLQFAQVPGKLIIVHPSHPAASLTRVANNVWDLANLSYSTSSAIGTPTGFALYYEAPQWFTSEAYALNDVVSNDGDVYRCILGHTSAAGNEPGTGASWTTYWALKLPNAGGGFQYVVTAVDGYGTESVATSALVTDQGPTTGAWASVHLSWNSVASAVTYKLYRGTSSTDYRPIANANALSFTDAEQTNAAYIGYGGPTVATPIFATENNYPSTVAFHQQRLILGGTNAQPDVVRASRTADPFNFTISSPIQDDDAISWRQLANRSTRVNHLLNIANSLIGFTNVGEFVVTGGGDGILRPGEINPTVFSYNGASSLEPLPLDSTALYVQARGSKVLSLTIGGQAGSLGEDLSLTAAHLIDGYVISGWAYQEIPHSVVWMVRNDGTLLSLAYVREIGVTAWSRNDTSGSFESVCSVPEGDEDAVYVVVNRTVNGSTVRYIERLADRLASVPVLVDCGKTYTSPGSNTITGLSHLNGRQVSVVADGVVKASPNNPAYTTVTVSSGQITVAGLSTATNVQVGLPYTVDVETLDIDQGRGSIKNDNIRIGEVFVWIQNSGSFYIGPKAVSGTALTGMELYTPVNDEAYPLPAGQTFTGVAPVTLQSTYTKNGRIFIRQPDPVPLTVLAVIPEGVINGRG